MLNLVASIDLNSSSVVKSNIQIIVSFDFKYASLGFVPVLPLLLAPPARPLLHVLDLFLPALFRSLTVLLSRNKRKRKSRDSNRRPLEWQSSVLTTRPRHSPSRDKCLIKIDDVNYERSLNDKQAMITLQEVVYK